MKKRYSKKLITALVVNALIAIIMVCCMAFVMPKNEDISTSAIATSSDSINGGYPVINISQRFNSDNFVENLKLKNKDNSVGLDVVEEKYFVRIEITEFMYLNSLHQLQLSFMNENYNTLSLIFDFNAANFCCEYSLYTMDTTINGIKSNAFDCYKNKLIIDIFFEESKIDIYGYDIEGFPNGLGDYLILSIDDIDHMNFINDILNSTTKYDYDVSSDSDVDYAFSVTENYQVYTNFKIPPREGYTFKGLYYDEEFTQPYTGDPVKPLEELFQKWEINTYTVTFDWRDEENWQYDTPISKTYKYGEEIDFVPEREYYGFIGWFNDATGEPFDGVVKSDLYLIGKWDKYHVFVTYMDTDLSILNTEQLFMGEIARWIPRKVGYKFKYWTLNGEIYEDVNAPLMQNVTLVAHFEKIDCTVTIFINNNVYKAYKVDYDLPLLEFLDEIGIKKNFVAKYAFTDFTGSNTPINELAVTKDMRVDLSDSYITINNIKEEVKANSKLIAIVFASIGVLIVVFILGAIFSGKKKKSKR